jgi:hypothetical protein
MMNFIFKIIENHPETEQFVIKYCRQNSLVSIDDCRAYAIDYQHIDFTTYESFILSVMKCGRSIIIKQIEEEIGIESNYNVEFSNSTEIEDNLNKIVSVDYEQVVYDISYSMNRIDL